ncbi:MAG: ParB/RepB/Spo0J family partition protein [Phycisphaerae bacterium]|nr:ParB/RepB/Spo0J family partition protein [Phycisphaerae bacterium]
MSKTGRRLGRGLSSLVGSSTTLESPGQREAIVPNPAPPPPVDATPAKGSESPRPIPASQGSAASSSVAMLPATLISPNPFQPRTNVAASDITSLADSIRKSGILQPVTVRKSGERYQIIAGERRFAAARQAGLAEIPVLIRNATDQEMLELALVENIQREDLNPIDRARAYREYCDRFGLRPDDVAARLGEDRSTVSNYLRILDLSPDLQQLVARGAISMGHARCLLGIPEDARRLELAKATVANELSVRALEEIVRRERARPEPGTTQPAAQPRFRSRHVEELERQFEQSLRTKVRIQEGKRKGTGRIVIDYFSLDDFDRIAERLGIDLDRS